MTQVPEQSRYLGAGLRGRKGSWKRAAELQGDILACESKIKNQNTEYSLDNEMVGILWLAGVF